MERIDKNTIMPVRGDESQQNIMEFEDVFGVRFGAAGKIRQGVGTADRQDENAGDFCIHFRTGDLTETNVGFDMEMSPMAMMLFRGVFSQSISAKPWSNVGDEDNIAESVVGQPKVNAMTFLSGDGKDPREGTQLVQTFDRRGKLITKEVPIPKRPDGGLRPNTDYYLTQRCKRKDGTISPSNIRYVGTDDAEHGGEVLIESAPVVNDPDAVQIDINIAGMPGIWTPTE